MLQDVLREAELYSNQVLVAHESDDFQVVERWEPVTEVDVQTPLDVYQELVGAPGLGTACSLHRCIRGQVQLLQTPCQQRHFRPGLPAAVQLGCGPPTCACQPQLGVSGTAAGAQLLCDDVANPVGHSM